MFSTRTVNTSRTGTKKKLIKCFSEKTIQIKKKQILSAHTIPKKTSRANRREVGGGGEVGGVGERKKPENSRKKSLPTFFDSQKEKAFSCPFSHTEAGSRKKKF